MFIVARPDKSDGGWAPVRSDQTSGEAPGAHGRFWGWRIYWIPWVALARLPYHSEPVIWNAQYRPVVTLFR